jgi:ribonuclease P protein subunit RPR2
MAIVTRGYRRRPAALLATVRKEVDRLFDEAELLFRQGKGELARRRVRRARRTAMKAQLRIPDHAERYCRGCDSYLVPGVNATVRLKGGVRIRRCLECGAVRRKAVGRKGP